MAKTGQLVGQPLRPAELGFGCARLLMRADRKQAAELVETALDAGIRHIDVARSYGDGRTETLVGEIARGRRSQMTIVTKAGLSPPGPLSRALRKASALAGHDRDAPASRSFDARIIRQSVEQSLRSLNTDYVDALLLHGCLIMDISEELRRVLEGLKQSGKTLKLGVAASAEEASAIAASYPELADLLQVEAAAYDRVKAPAGAQIITHSVFDRPGIEQEPAERLTDALLQNPGGVVLFSSSNPAHIRSNARMAHSLATAPASETRSLPATAA